MSTGPSPITESDDGSGVPTLEDDATVEQVPTEPVAAEYGSWSFTRDLASHIGNLLRLPVEAMTIRTNPWYRRPCPKVTVYDLTVGEHHIAVTAYETRHPLIRGPIDTYALVIDDNQVPFARSGYGEALEWELARAAWIAISDRQIAAERAARAAADLLAATGEAES